LGNYLYVPVREISEAKFKDVGTHISNIIKVSDGEKIVKSIAVNKFNDSLITLFTKNGMVKRVSLKLFEVSRYTKPISCIKLKDRDELVSVSRCDGENTVVVTSDGYALKYSTSEIPDLGLKTSGVKSIKLNSDATVVNAFVVSEFKDYLCIFTDRNTAKRIHIDDLDKTTRAKKGSAIIKSPKSKKYTVIKAFNIGSKNIFGIIDKEIGYIKSSDISILDKASTGATDTKKNVDNIFVVTKYTDITNQPKEEKVLIEESKEVVKEETKEEVKEEKKDQQLTMSDFFEEFKI
jgi:topoisomerase-4 subunit A